MAFIGIMILVISGIVWLTGYGKNVNNHMAQNPGPLLVEAPTQTAVYERCGLSKEHQQRIGMLPSFVQEKLLQQLEEPEETTPSVPQVFLRPGEPRTFEQYNGQHQVLGLLKNSVGALRPEERCIRPQLFAGWAGGGKTLLAKVVANELNARNVLYGHSLAPFFEYMPVALEDVSALDDLMRKVQRNPGAIVFLDEVHAVAGQAHFLKFYQVLEENRYHFEGEEFPVQLPPTTYIAATTDYGILAEAFKRRWTTHFFQPATAEQLKTYVRNRPFPVETPALDAIVERTHYSGAPWESLRIYDMAVDSAKANGRTVVTPTDVQAVFTLHGVDELGLSAIDRQVLGAMFLLRKTKADGETRFAGSEDSVIGMARVDRSEFKSRIRPKLMSRGLLEIRPYWGHTLTARAESTYANLRT